MTKMTDAQLAELIRQAETPQQVRGYLDAVATGRITVVERFVPINAHVERAPKPDRPSRRQRQRKLLTRAKP